jgi:hypothetical protein
MPRIFTWIKQNTPQLLSDLKLLNRVITELKKMRRWIKRVVGGNEFCSTSRRDETSLDR